MSEIYKKQHRTGRTLTVTPDRRAQRVLLPYARPLQDGIKDTTKQEALVHLTEEDRMVTVGVGGKTKISASYDHWEDQKVEAGYVDPKRDQLFEEERKGHQRRNYRFFYKKFRGI
ncbi:hypothetical protein Trydic_g16151 [Trypoxylus dichotomus]